MAKRDYYEVLGVERGASDDALKQSYRRLAMKYHPDRSPDDAQAEERFKEAKEAYEVLSNPQQRGAYDQFGHDGLRADGLNASGYAGGFRDVFDDVFGDIFGARGGGSRAYRGADLRYPLELDLERAVAGDTVTIQIPTAVDCATCGGSGARAGTEPVSCETCGGNGQVRMQQGFFSLQQTCPRCKGAGRVIADPCGSCRGAGKVRERKTLSVKIPPGVDNGDRIRLTGEGENGSRPGASGDLYVEVTVRDHPIFERHGNDLSCEVPISFATAALGGDIHVPTLGGAVKIKVPEGTQTGGHFRLRGKGVKSVRSSTVGDLMCRVVVETPVKLTSRQKELLGEFEAALKGGDESAHAPRAASWFNGVRRFFEDMRS